MFKVCKSYISYTSGISGRLSFPRASSRNFDVKFASSTLGGQVAALASSPPGTTGTSKKRHFMKAQRKHIPKVERRSEGPEVDGIRKVSECIHAVDGRLSLD